jgi:segregation and condensation protein B
LERSELKLIIESLLFAGEAPIQLKKIHEVFPDVSLKELREILEKLKEEYENLNRSFYLREVANGYQLCTKPEYAGWIRKLKKTRPSRLSPATMETLAIIAYKQPITRAEIEQIRGVDTAGILRSLLEKKLIKITGKKDVPGRPLLYGTTSKFLTMFGLKGLKDLPTLEDIEQLDEQSLPLFSEKLQDIPIKSES